jgi:hypothetical protein
LWKLKVVSNRANCRLEKTEKGRAKIWQRRR